MTKRVAATIFAIIFENPDPILLPTATYNIIQSHTIHDKYNHNGLILSSEPTQGHKACLL